MTVRSKGRMTCAMLALVLGTALTTEAQTNPSDQPPSDPASPASPPPASPGSPPARTPQPESPKSKTPDPKQEAPAADVVLAKGTRWQGIDSESITRTVVVTERSIKDNTATLTVSSPREVFTLYLRVSGSQFKVERATRKVKGTPIVDGDPAPEYAVRLDKDGVLRIGGNGHFDAPRAKVKNKVFPLNLTCKPMTSDDDAGDTGSDDGQKSGKGKKGKGGKNGNKN